MADLVASAPTGDFWLDMGSFSVAGNSGTSEGGAITGTSTPDFGSNLSASGADADTKNFLTEANSGNSSFTLNILQPSTIFNLLMGNDATLMTFSIPNLVISANYSRYFPVYGPLGMRLSGSASATLHLGFGYDTYGLQRSRETGNWSYLLDGFYVSDRANADGTGPDTPEVVFDLGFSAAAELNLGIASGGRLYLVGANPTFSSVENHTGGADRDYLVCSNDQYVVGLFDGNGSQDRIDLSDYQLVDVYKRNIWDFTGLNQGGVNEHTAFTETENHTGGQVGTNETLHSVYIRAADGVGGALTGTIEAGDCIRSLQTGAASSGTIDAPLLSRISLTGGFNGVIHAVGGAEEFDLLARQQNIGRLDVSGGDLLGTVEATSINSLSVRDGHLGADVTVYGDLRSLSVSGRDTAGLLDTSSLTVAGNLGSARIDGDLTGLWDIGGDVLFIRQSGTVNAWTLQMDDAAVSTVRSLYLGDVQQMAMTGLADVQSFRSDAFADGSLEANSINGLYSTGDFLADVTLQGNALDGDDVLGQAYVRGAVTDATWQLTGSVGNVCLYGNTSGLTLVASGNLGQLRVNQAAGLNVLVGIDSAALDDGTVTADEVVNADATIRSVQVGWRRGDGDVAAASDVILAAPIFGSVAFTEVDDLGQADGSAIWLGADDALTSLQSRNSSAADLTWSYRPTQDAPWPPALEPLRVVA